MNSGDSHDVDIVRLIIDRLIAELPDITVETAWKIEQTIRHEYGGQRVYIRATPTRDTRVAAVKRAVANGARVSDLCESVGISRSTIYNILKVRNKHGDHT